MEFIGSAGLSDKRWVAVDKVCAHPGNREKTGMVFIDMQDLLRRIAANGWSWQELDALACEIALTS